MAELKSVSKPAPAPAPAPKPAAKDPVAPVAAESKKPEPEKTLITVKTIHPYRLHVSTQGRYLDPQVPTEVKNDQWIQGQIKGKVLEEVK
jgi:hypothetical protein